MSFVLAQGCRGYSSILLLPLHIDAIFIHRTNKLHYSFNLSKLTLLLSHDTNDVNVS